MNPDELKVGGWYLTEDGVPVVILSDQMPHTVTLRRLRKRPLRAPVVKERVFQAGLRLVWISTSCVVTIKTPEELRSLLPFSGGIMRDV